MAFDLNKNKDSDSGDEKSPKSAPSKFNLAKNTEGHSAASNAMVASSAADAPPKSSLAGKFSLEKAGAETPPAEAQTQVGSSPKSQKSPMPVLSLVAVVLAVGLLWFFMQGDEAVDEQPQPNTPTLNGGDAASAPAPGSEVSVESGLPGASGDANSVADSNLNPSEMLPANDSPAEPAQSERLSSGRDSNAIPGMSADAESQSSSVSGTSVSSANTAASVTAQTFTNQVVANFSQSGAEIKAMDSALVSMLIDYLRSNPGEKLMIHGYASSEGDINYNQQLSLNRANSFKDHLKSQGIPSSSLVALGKGVENPVATNDTEAGRRENRRVEILIE
jgi:outer membrane protein OmpA-like peptidoglycan-associated protein